MRRIPETFPALALAGALLASPARAAEETGTDQRFAPVAELAGHCWSGAFPDSQARDLHCWEWVLDGNFLRDRHRVTGGESAYSGETFYGWDAEAGKLRFWYFNTLGGVSTGTVERDGERWLFRELYSGSGDAGGGAQLEIRNSFVREDDVSYSVVSEKRREDGGWQGMFSMRLVRLGARPAKTGGPWAESYDLAFNTDRDDNYEIYARDLETGEERNLTSAAGTEWVYAPDQGSLVVISDRAVGSEPGYRLHRLGLPAGELSQLSDFLVADSWVGVMPEGRGYVVCAPVDGDKELLLLGADGRIARRLTDNDADDCQPDVTPDGRTVVFWSNRGGSGELWAMDLGPEGGPGEARTLTRFPGNDAVPAHRYGGEGPPRISPDGTRVAWPSIRDGEDWDVYVMNLDGSGARRLTDHLADDGYVAWSPDGRYLAFDSDRFGSHDIFVMRADGSDLARVTDHPANELGPVWIPRPSS